MIERLARALRQAGIDTDAVQLAEILWVATRQPTAEQPVEHAELPEDTAPTAELEPAPSPVTPGGPQPEITPAPPLMYLTPTRPVSGEAVEVRLPAPVALADRLRISRALRTLKRRHLVPRLREFDLDGTIELYGETGLLAPLIRPGSERWFDVTMVVDAGPTMDVWTQTTTELAKLLASHGAFRRVRRLRLINDGGLPYLLDDSDQRHHPRRVGSHDGRQLTLVISDCVGALWYGSAVWEMIREWGRRGPVVLVQTLPSRLWESTALGPADARVTSYRPGQPNITLRVSQPWWSIGEDDERADVLPVVGLNETDLASWARMVMGGADVSVAGVLTEPTGPWLAAPVDMPAAERVSVFKSTVSMEAYQLAVCLAAVPIRLPVARIVQYAIVGSRDLVHLAEVFASGLIERVTSVDAAVPPDEVAYDFVPGVRDVLQGALTGTRTLEIFRAVAHYLEKTIGASASFTALLTGATGTTEADPAFQPFAEVEVQLLDRLRLRSMPLPDETPTRPELPPLPWAHAILIGPHELEEFAVWLTTDAGLPPERITWLRNDYSVRAFQQAVRSAATRQPASGLLFVLLAGEVRGSELLTDGFPPALRPVTEAAAFSAIVTVTLATGTSVASFGGVENPSAFLGYSGASISQLIEALSGEGTLVHGTITAESLDRYLGDRASSRFSSAREPELIVLRGGPEPPQITRWLALVVGIRAEEDEANRLAARLREIGYEVRTLLGSVSGQALWDDITALTAEASEQDLLWLHVSANRGVTQGDDDVRWLLEDDMLAPLSALSGPLVWSGAGAVVITAETRKISRFQVSPSPWDPMPARTTGDRVRDFLQLSAEPLRSDNRLVPALLARLAQAPHQTELRTLLDPGNAQTAGFLDRRRMSVDHWGELNVPLAPEPRS